MTMNDSENRGLSSDINVTPLIDVLLVLLIIFMVIVPVMPRGEQAAVPSPSGYALSSGAIVLEVLGGKDGQVSYRLNQAVINRDQISARLAEVFRTRENPILFVKGDDQVAFNRIAEIVDLGHAAGAVNVGLLTPGSAH
jgi:biopolymer transport protein ExbD/biopolymer transport protein TolR